MSGWGWVSGLDSEGRGCLAEAPPKGRPFQAGSWAHHLQDVCPGWLMEVPVLRSHAWVREESHDLCLTEPWSQ